MAGQEEQFAKHFLLTVVGGVTLLVLAISHIINIEDFQEFTIMGFIAIGLYFLLMVESAVITIALAKCLRTRQPIRSFAFGLLLISLLYGLYHTYALVFISTLP
jgi:hypothetical protein